MKEQRKLKKINVSKFINKTSDKKEINVENGMRDMKRDDVKQVKKRKINVHNRVASDRIRKINIDNRVECQKNDDLKRRSNKVLSRDKNNIPFQVCNDTDLINNNKKKFLKNRINSQNDIYLNKDNKHVKNDKMPLNGGINAFTYDYDI